MLKGDRYVARPKRVCIAIHAVQTHRIALIGEYAQIGKLSSLMSGNLKQQARGTAQ